MKGYCYTTQLVSRKNDDTDFVCFLSKYPLLAYKKCDFVLKRADSHRVTSHCNCGNKLYLPFIKNVKISAVKQACYIKSDYLFIFFYY